MRALGCMHWPADRLLHGCACALELGGWAPPPTRCMPFRLPAGYRHKEVVGRGRSFLQGLQGPDTDPVVLAEIQEALSEG